MKIEPKGLTVSRDETGEVWLQFDCENGNSAAISMTSLASNYGPIVKRNLLLWREEQPATEAKP